MYKGAVTKKKSHRVTPRSNLRFCYFCRVASCKKSWMGSTFCCNFQQSSQVAERVTPSLQLASLFSMCKFVASCKKNRIVHVTVPLLREGKFRNAIYLTHLYA